MPYLCVHFKEKLTSDGEQVYFAVSKNGYDWEKISNGEPILNAKLSEKGCRDIEIIRHKNGEFIILTTDLCIVRRMDENGNIDWKKVNSTGSKYLRMWKSRDLIDFSEEKLIYFGRDDFGCLWAPEVFYDEKNDDYLIHWGSTVSEDDFSHMSIYYSLTKDFERFTKPEVLFTKTNEILDSHIVKKDDTYYLFYKNSNNPPQNMLCTSKNLYSGYTENEEFNACMNSLENAGSYEAATTFVLPDGKWCLMLDFFGCAKEKMGYVPFVSTEYGNLNFENAKELFSFPYGFKHGRVIEITEEEYEKLIEYYN